MSLPTLSVILPNFNHARYLPGCLNALLQQSVQPQEIIVIDDASKDNSVAIVEEFARKHSNIRLVRNEANGGVIARMNDGLHLASGEYVYYCGADDLVLPGFFEKALRLLSEHKDAGLCCSDPASFTGEPGQEPVINENRLRLSASPAFFTGDQLVEIARRQRLLISGMSLIKRSAVQEAGLFRADLKWHCDFFVMFLVAFRHGICYIPGRLNLWRATPGSYLNTGMKDRREQQAVVTKILDLLLSPPYRDVLPRFQKSGILCLTPGAMMTSLLDKKYRSFFNFTLVKRALPAEIFWRLPYGLRSIIRTLRAKLN